MVKTIYLAAGCFWGSEKYFSLIRGVIGTKVGYANGSTENPTYEDVSYHNSGHAETVEIKYDDTILSLEKLLSLYYDIIDPTSINQQGADRGVQYRTGIYYIDDSDYYIICDSLDALATKYENPLQLKRDLWLIFMMQKNIIRNTLIRISMVIATLGKVLLIRQKIPNYN